MNMAALSALQPVGVVGAGAMGAGIAQVAALAGHPVRLFDLRADAARQAVDSQRAQLAQLAGKGRLDAALAEAASARLSAVSELAELAGCALVIEAIVEQLEAKQALFSQLEAIVGDDALLASNTSSISLTAIAAPLTRPQRLAGLHFFNPAPRMALVEVIAGLATAPEVIDTLMATARAWGKTPVRAKSTPGFIVNRVARPYYAEALRLAQEGAASPATLDALLREAGGFRMGPFELMDMIGHDVNFAVTSSVWRGYFHDPRFLPSLMQQDLVEAGFLGRKRGRGFYDYRDGAAMPQADSAPPLPPPAQLAVCGDSPAARALAARLHAHGVAFAALPSIDGRVAQADDAVLFVTDGRSASQRAADLALPNLLLIDLALDYHLAPRLAAAAADGCAPAARDAGLGLLQAAGLAVSLLDDAPGLVVMRTVAMLANEAADAVHQGVCSAADADAAMQLGVNYPRGPLAWAEQIGLAQVRQVLAHLAACYGEDRYRISPRLQRAALTGRILHD